MAESSLTAEIVNQKSMRCMWIDNHTISLLRISNNLHFHTYSTDVTPLRQAIDALLKFFNNNAFPFRTPLGTYEWQECFIEILRLHPPLDHMTAMTFHCLCTLGGPPHLKRSDNNQIAYKVMSRPGSQSPRGDVLLNWESATSHTSPV